MRIMLISVINITNHNVPKVNTFNRNLILEKILKYFKHQDAFICNN